MTPEELKKLEETVDRYTVGRQADVEQILQSLSKRKKPASIVLTGPPGVGKTEMFKKIAERFKDVIPFEPLSAADIKLVAAHMIDRHEGLPADRKDEAKAIIHELLDQGVMDSAQGLRGLQPVVNAIAAVSQAPDMREALASQYPMFINRVSVRTGERLADEFTGGTAARTQARKPVKFKSREKSRGVGFFTLN